MTNVASLYGGPTGVPEVNDLAVEVLRDMLAKAEAGEVVGVVIASLRHDGLAGFRTGGKVGGYSLLGALEMAKADMVAILTEWQS